MILFSTVSLGQKKEILMADSLYDDLQFSDAAASYEKAIQKIRDISPEKLYATFMLAECYMIMNNPDLAEP
jgi:hypothetical protein